MDDRTGAHIGTILVLICVIALGVTFSFIQIAPASAKNKKASEAHHVAKCLLPKEGTAGARPMQVHQAEKAGYTVVGHGPMPSDPKITTWVLKSKRGAYSVLFRAPGGAVFGGPALDRSGKDITPAILRHFVIHEPLSKVYAGLKDSRFSVLDGSPKAKRSIVVIGDANCYYTHMLWQELRPYVASGKIKVHWVFAPIIHANSAGKAARILTSDNRERALTENETQYDAPHEEGGAKPLPADAIPAAMRRDFKTNVSWIERLGTNGTPTILSPDHGQVEVINGVPTSITSLIHPRKAPAVATSTDTASALIGSGKACSG